MRREPYDVNRLSISLVCLKVRTKGFSMPAIILLWPIAGAFKDGDSLTTQGKVCLFLAPQFAKALACTLPHANMALDRGPLEEENDLPGAL